jgi:branched-chain amino acid transport system permease protein
MLYAIFHDTKLGGGSDGIYITVRPEMIIGSFKALDLESPVQFFYLALITLSAVYGLLNYLLHAPFGRALAGIRVNEQRMRSIGFRFFRTSSALSSSLEPIAGLSGLSRGVPVRLC